MPKEIIKMFMQIRKFQTDKNEFGQYVISIKNGKAHLIGDGFTKDGQFPLLMSLILKTSKPKDYTLLKHQM